MSSKKKIDVTCPNCQHQQSVIIWQSLNVTLNPESKQNLFDNQINLFKCENCETETPLETDLIYHDMQKEFCAIYVSFSWLYENNAIAKFTRRGELRDFVSDDDEKEYDYMSHPQIVFGMDELIRYAKFRDKLFDDYSAAAKSDKPIFW